MSVLVVAAHDGKTVRSNVANAVAAAGLMGSPVEVLVAGSNAGEAAKSAAAISTPRACGSWSPASPLPGRLS